MTTYIVTFEVASLAKMDELKGRLKAYETYCPIHNNCWAIVTNQSAVQVRDNLMEIVNSPDRIFVIKSGMEAAWNSTFGEKNTDWLKERL